VIIGFCPASSRAALPRWSLGHLTDASVIIAVIVVNAIVGFVQESKVENALLAILVAFGTSWADVDRRVLVCQPCRECETGQERYICATTHPSDRRICDHHPRLRPRQHFRHAAIDSETPSKFLRQKHPISPLSQPPIFHNKASRGLSVAEPLVKPSSAGVVVCNDDAHAALFESRACFVC
jgi:hypothetical protein